MSDETSGLGYYISDTENGTLYIKNGKSIAFNYAVSYIPFASKESVEKLNAKLAGVISSKGILTDSNGSKWQLVVGTDGTLST